MEVTLTTEIEVDTATLRLKKVNLSDLIAICAALLKEVSDKTGYSPVEVAIMSLQLIEQKGEMPSEKIRRN